MGYYSGGALSFYTGLILSCMVALLTLSARLLPPQELAPDSPPKRPTTLVTALYDIQRADRPFASYKRWLTHTALRLARAPMVIYASEQDLPWIRIARRAANATARTRCVANATFPLAHLVARAGALSAAARRLSGPERDNARYIPLQFSKAVWLMDAMRRDPFGSDVFFWIDAGASRFIRPGAPLRLLLAPSALVPERVYVTATASFYASGYLAGQTADSLIGTQEAYLMGTAFGGHAAPLRRVCEGLLGVLQTDMLDAGRIDNEQVGLAVLYARHPAWFATLDAASLRCDTVCLSL